jgi:hypothetical protein
MNRRRKTELDLLGREMFEQARLEAESVEKIAASPDAYSSVLARIKQEKALNSADVSRKTMLGFGRLAVAACALVIVSFVSLSIIYRDGREVALDHKVELPVQEPEIARPVIPPGDIESEQPISRAKYSDTVIEKVSAKKPSPRRIRDAGDEPPLAEFVSLGLPGTPQHTADGGRVIRVELPAASLFAMGVNVPLENGSEMLKADLIVGPDGVTRAVKLVE